MKIVKADGAMADALAPLIADFRVVLSSFRGVAASPDPASGREEFLEFLNDGYPVYAAAEGERLLGYIVLKIEPPCLWVEQLYVREEARRKGVASALFDRAEEIAGSMGEETVFNYVHPNNDAIIAFLRSRGYTVLNMIELRKPYRGEKPTAAIRVGEHVFDY